MRRPEMTSMGTSLTRQFIRNPKSFCLISQTLFYPVRLVLEVGLLYVRYPRGVSVCSFRSSTPTCTPSLPLCLDFTMVFQDTRIVVTPEFICEVLHVLGVDRHDYPRHTHLSFVS